MRPPTAIRAVSDGAVTIRKYREADAEQVFLAVRESINEISPWMPWCHPEYSLEDSRVWSASRDDAWSKGLEYDFVINRLGHDALLGVCGLNHFDYEVQMANMGYWIRTSETRKGAATSAVLLLARFGFERLGLNRIEILVSTLNMPSQRVAENAGAKKEGIVRNRLVVRGKVLDAVMYSLVPEDLAGS